MLFMILYDSHEYPVEALTMVEAVVMWKGWGKVRWAGEWDGTEEPESCALISENAVIQASQFLPTAPSTMGDILEEAEKLVTRVQQAGGLLVGLADVQKLSHLLPDRTGVSVPLDTTAGREAEAIEEHETQAQASQEV